MQDFQRYAIYYAPDEAGFAASGASWLGWDAAAGCVRAQPQFASLDMDAVTNRPRKYGLHGTIKPPFALAAGSVVDDLAAALDRLCDQLQTVHCDGLELQRIGRFLALVPIGDLAQLSDLAATVVQGLDQFRAPLGAGELARRRSRRLTPKQDLYLQKWGYPYVMDEFKFHITLTGPLADDTAPMVQAAIGSHISPFVPQPFVIKDLCLFGEAVDGRFHILSRHSLGG